MSRQSVICIEGTEYHLDPFLDEDSMKNYVNNNSDAVLGLKFIATELVLDGYKIDSLCFDDQNSRLVIVEFKLYKSPGLLEQGMAYLNIAKRNFKSILFDFIYKFEQYRERVEDLRYDSTGLVLVSHKFTNHQSEISSQFSNIKWIELTRYTNGDSEIVLARDLTESIGRPIPINMGNELSKKNK